MCVCVYIYIFIYSIYIYIYIYHRPHPSFSDLLHFINQMLDIAVFCFCLFVYFLFVCLFIYLFIFLFFFFLFSISDLFTQQYCNPPPSQTFNFQDIGLKPLEKTFAYPSDMSIGGRAFFTPTIGQLSPLKKSTGQNTVTVDCGSSGGQPQCRDQPMNSHYNSSPRPLPPVPQLLY